MNTGSVCAAHAFNARVRRREKKTKGLAVARFRQVRERVGGAVAA